MNEQTKPARRPRWFQFSLRALFVLMLGAPAYFAGFTTSEKLARKAIQDARDKAAAEIANAQQQAALAAVVNHPGVTLTYPPNFPTMYLGNSGSGGPG